MSDREELELARRDMIAVLDEKLANSPEWRALRAIDRALASVMWMEEKTPAIPAARAPKAAVKPRGPRADSYVELGLKAMTEFSRPMPTDKMIEYIGRFRSLDGEPKKIKVNVQSAFSKDERFQNIVWEGGRAWWFADKPIPMGNSAGTLLEAPANTH